MAGFTAKTGRDLDPDLKGQGMHRYRTSPGMGFGGLGITPAVKGLLIANVAIFMLQNVVRDIAYWGVFNTQVAIFNMQLWRFVTYMFLHGDFSHLLFNMFGLWMFGSQIEALWGQRSFLTFYFVCGLGGAFLYALFDLIGIGDGASMLGASGAIYGILLAYGMTFPNNIILIGFIFPMKAKYAVILFGLIELMATASGSGGGVAHLAHLGGMLAGFLFIMLTIPGISRQMSAAGSRRLDAHQDGTPMHARTERGKRYQGTFGSLAFLPSLMKADRQGSSRGISVFLNIVVDLLGW